MEVNFDGVEAAVGISMTMPGTIGLFKIEKVEFGLSKEKQTPFMKLNFACQKVRQNDGTLVDEQSTFNHSFYMSPAALKRVQYLAKVMFGQEFTGSLNEQQLTIAFEAKTVALKVTGQVSDKGKGYPDLSFAGYAKSASEFIADTSILSFNAQESRDVADALEAISSSKASNADQESQASSPQPGAGKKPF